MPSIASRIAPRGWKPTFAVGLEGLGATSAPPASGLPGVLQSLVPSGDMAEGYLAGAVPRSPVFTPIFRPTPLAVIAPGAKSTATTNRAGVSGASTAKVYTPPASAPVNLQMSATGSGAGVTVSWTPPAQNGAGKLLGATAAQVKKFQVYRGPLGGGFGAASLLATVTSSPTPQQYNYTDPNGLTDKYEYYVRAVTAKGAQAPTLAVNVVVAGSSTQVPPTGSGGSGTGQILAIAIHTAGTGYQVGDMIDITGGGGSGATVQVTQVDPGGFGHIFGISLVAGGLGYSTGTNLGTSGGSGIGNFTVDISSVA